MVTFLWPTPKLIHTDNVFLPSIIYTAYPTRSQETWNPIIRANSRVHPKQNACPSQGTTRHTHTPTYTHLLTLTHPLTHQKQFKEANQPKMHVSEGREGRENQSFGKKTWGTVRTCKIHTNTHIAEMRIKSEKRYCFQ